jgi:multisubunit Na+/H+ antiporter MnhF subunit
MNTELLCTYVDVIIMGIFAVFQIDCERGSYVSVITVYILVSGAALEEHLKNLDAVIW